MDENLKLLKSDPPEEIVFVGPHEKGTHSKLNLTNISKGNVYFKVLTTDPLAFCVKPKMGKVEPGETTQVCITLRNDDPKYYLEKQPKFKILTVENTNEDENPKVLWNGDKTDVCSIRYSCNFLQFDSLCTTDTSEISDLGKSKKNADDVRPTNYETSGSSMSLKEESPAKKNVKVKSVKLFQMKHLVLGLLAVFVAYVAASTLMKNSVQG